MDNNKKNLTWYLERGINPPLDVIGDSSSDEDEKPETVERQLDKIKIKKSKKGRKKTVDNNKKKKQKKIKYIEMKTFSTTQLPQQAGKRKRKTRKRKRKKKRKTRKKRKVKRRLTKKRR